MSRTLACSFLATRRQFIVRSLFGAALSAFFIDVASTSAQEADAFLEKETVLLLPPGKDNPRNSEETSFASKQARSFSSTRGITPLRPTTTPPRASSQELRIPKVEIGRPTTRLFSKMKGDST